MFEQLFTQPVTIAHDHSSPYASERQQYLSQLMEEGRSRNSLRIIAELLILVAIFHDGLPREQQRKRPAGSWPRAIGLLNGESGGVGRVMWRCPKWPGAW